MKLTTDHRNNLPASDFAVPETRQLPMHDKGHIEMAWKMVDRTQGLNDEQRSKARRRILSRAKKFGIDTSEWEKHDLKACETIALWAALENVTIEAANESHPNKMPFKGILTRLDEPSDAPVGGTVTPSNPTGYRVVLPSSVARKNLNTLIDMPINFTPGFDNHDQQSIIGIMKSASIQGDAIEIAGFFYCADYPSETQNIQAEKSQLGFSYEAKVNLKPMGNGIAEAQSCTFTGAALLYKKKAAYQTTSLTAKSETLNDEDLIMSQEIKDMLDALTATVGEMSNEMKEIKAQQEKTTLSAKSAYTAVMPHVNALRAAAKDMHEGGIGTDPMRGHVYALHCMADHLEAEGAAGRTPHVFTQFLAPGDLRAQAAAKTDESTKALEDKFNALTTQISDLKAAAFKGSPAPERKTIPPFVAHVLARAGHELPADGQLTASKIDEVAEKAHLSIAQRIAMKTALSN